MTRKELFEEIKAKQSFLCVGLDTDIDRIPKHLLDEEDPIFAFNKAIIDATKDLCVAYKPNIAFYESLGASGWESLKKTVDYIPENIFTIADAKRGDIGNTTDQYAKAFFQNLKFDSITIAPYMGRDSVDPFLKYEGKWSILLALTSNASATDFQLLSTTQVNRCMKRCWEKSATWGSEENTMYVVGATKAEMLGSIRKVIPNHFLLVPGVGAQGGSLEEVAQYGMNDHVGLLVNSSRGIIYADSTEGFAETARKKALEIQQSMASILADCLA